MRERQRDWVFLYRKEKGRRVYIYEPLRKKQLAVKLKQGWVVYE
ncbi:hypothetical protein [Peribacillus loiseleuriae]